MRYLLLIVFFILSVCLAFKVGTIHSSVSDQVSAILATPVPPDGLDADPFESGRRVEGLVESLRCGLLRTDLAEVDRLFEVATMAQEDLRKVEAELRSGILDAKQAALKVNRIQMRFSSYQPKPFVYWVLVAQWPLVTAVVVTSLITLFAFRPKRGRMKSQGDH